MVTGGKKPPEELALGGKTADTGGLGAVVSAAGQNVVQARNAKRTALDEFSKENNLKPESIKKAYKRFQAADRDQSGLVDYTELCEMLQVDPSPQCEAVFQLYDYDKTGQIDAREVGLNIWSPLLVDVFDWLMPPHVPLFILDTPVF